jgi:hypothetical protein
VIDDETARFLEGGCSLIVGAVGPAGTPFATRAWGIDVFDGSSLVRLLLAADDQLVAPSSSTGALAVTATDVKTFRSLQLKGHITGIGPATGEDRARFNRYCDELFTNITESDGAPRAVLLRILPIDVVACIVEVDGTFDQTPGPRAGTALGPGRA